VLTDETGTVTDTRAYEAFGTVNQSAGTDTLAYGFAGEPLDPTTHLNYHRARWMDPRVGRFEGMDPDRRSAHRYLYVRDNPVNRWDPSGLYDDSISTVVGDAEPTYGYGTVQSLAGQCNGQLSLTYLGPYPASVGRVQAQFMLALDGASGSNSSQCNVLQLARGTTWRGGQVDGVGSFDNWTIDSYASLGFPYWWYGPMQRWNAPPAVFHVDWGWKGNIAKWDDTPGFEPNGVQSPAQFPEEREFEFVTKVENSSSGVTKYAIYWTMDVRWTSPSSVPSVSYSQRPATPSEMNIPDPNPNDTSNYTFP
jgi:RHS repeat-associated protein